MAERSGAERPRESSPDVVPLLVGVFSVAVAAAAAFDWAGELQWVLAIAAVAVGAAMLVGSVRSRRKP